MVDDNYEKTFLIKMAICSENETQLSKFLSMAIDNEEYSLNFDNLISILPESILLRRNPIQSLLQWRVTNWGLAYDCDLVIKNVKYTENLFNPQDMKTYVEYLQYTTLSNIPAKLFLKLSNYFNELRFILIFVKNDLSVCGRLIIENNEILDHLIVDEFNEETRLLLRYMYDENYPNLIYGIF